MPSDVDIVNLGLTLLGEQRIQSFTQSSKAARSANAIYFMERDNELRIHQWNFATARALLPALTAIPVFGYQFAYELPADYLRVIQVGDVYPGARRVLGTVVESQNEYQIEGQTIVTNPFPVSGQPFVPPPSPPGPLQLRYTRRVTDPNQFDASFVNALGCRMAMKLCEDLTQDGNKRKLAASEYREAILAALRANAIELPPDALPDNSWILSRLPG